MSGLIALAAYGAFCYLVGRAHGRNAEQAEVRKAAGKLFGLFKKDE